MYYINLKEELDRTWDLNTVFPVEGLYEIGFLERDQRISFAYKKVIVVTTPEQ